MQHLEELSRESSANQQRSISKGLNISGTQTRCDSTVADQPETAGPRRQSLPAAEVDNDGSQGKKNNSSPLNEVVTTATSPSPSPSIENAQNTSQADENHNMKQSTEVLSLKATVDTLQTKMDALHADLRRADNTVSQLKRHIELNTASDGSQLPAFNAEVIVALVHEVEKLHAELDKLQPVSVSVQGRSNENMKEPASGDEPPVAAGRQTVKHGVDRATSPLSMQGLDSTLAAGDTAATDRRMRQRSASFGSIPQSGAEAQDKLPMKDELPGCDKVGIWDKTTTTARPLSTASFNSAEDQRSFLGSPVARNILRQSIMSCLSPFESTNDANQRTFAELQAEVARLRCQLQLAQLENSRLLERSARESVDSAGRPSVNPQAEMSLFLDGSLVKFSASGDITVAAGFLKKLVNVSISVYGR